MTVLRALVLGFVLLVSPPLRAETIEFQSPTYENLASFFGDPPPAVPLHGKLSIPPDAALPVPAVILLHTCIGPYTFEEFAGEHLRENGFATFEFDTLKPRGWTPADSCGGKLPQGPWAQLGDAYAALKTLANHPSIDPKRIAVAGGSMGGGTAFLSASEFIRGRLGGEARFAAHVAFYPGGSNAFHGPGAYAGAAPILLMLGSRDDWTPANRMVAVANFLRQEAPSIPITVKTYDAFHSWIGSAPRQHQAARKSFANCPYQMLKIDNTSVENAMLSVDGELTPIDRNDVAAVYRKCRTDGATTEGDRAVTKQSLVDFTNFLKEVMAR